MVLTRPDGRGRRGRCRPAVDTRRFPASTAAALINGVARIQADMEKLAVPVLILHGDADRITPPEGSRELFRRAGIADKELKDLSLQLP